MHTIKFILLCKRKINNIEVSRDLIQLEKWFFILVNMRFIYRLVGIKHHGLAEPEGMLLREPCRAGILNGFLVMVKLATRSSRFVLFAKY